MARYPENFTQNLSPEEFDSLPEHVVYEGNARDLQHLRGLLIPTREAERLIYVGERGSLWATFADGHRERPWLNCYITELDADGKPVVRDSSGGERIVTPGPNAMSTADLAKMGLTDTKLDALSQEVLGKPWEPDRLGKSDLRRERFDEVMGVVHGKP